MSSVGNIALTFDDGPDPVWTPLVLDALRSAGALATFFVVAPLAERHPELLRRVADEGRMAEGGVEAVKADDDVVPASRVREREAKVRELERLLGR